jgi:CxxC motif-containing protein (DUF1111 family)
MKIKLKLTVMSAACALAGLSTVCAGLPPQWLPPQEPAKRPHPDANPPLPPPPSGKFGDALPGLTRAQLAQFASGQEEFENVETPDGGLGPVFNNVSCAACHTTPVTGGASTNRVTRFGRMTRGVFDPLTDKGGSLLQAMAIDPLAQEFIPPEANVVAQRVTTPLFGLGLIEAIPDGAIRQLASQRKPDGVTGRVSEITDVTTGLPRVGRFGWKAQQATLLAFAGDAYLNEMGITSRFFPVENAPNGTTNLLQIFDAIADPEDAVDPATGRSDIDAAADFMRFLGPPPRLPLTPNAMAGQTTFQQINCAACHQPQLQTGPHAIAALDRKPVNLFSDLLLHDMGSLGDGIGQAAAGTREMRTAPLWGLRVRPAYLHDGRAPTVDAAIRAHDGEAARSRDNYLRLSPAQKNQLLEYLNSL